MNDSRRALFLAALVLLSPSIPARAQPAREADQQDLRLMLVEMREAFNQHQIERLVPFLHDHFSLIFSDGSLVTDPASLKAWYKNLFDPATGLLQSLTINPVPDEPAQLLGAETAIGHGTSTDLVVTRDGRKREIRSRWTATVVKAGGKWRLAGLQAGTNIFDNPVLDDYKAAIARTSTICGVVGLVAGALGAGLFRRQAGR
jgi:hypothetical protein